MSSLYMNIKKYRLLRGITQEELAEKLGYKSKSSIAKIELGDNDIPQSKIKAFADALGVSVGDLMGWDSDEEEKPSAESEELSENTISFIGRNGERVVKTYTAEQMETIRRLLDAIPSEDSDL